VIPVDIAKNAKLTITKNVGSLLKIILKKLLKNIINCGIIETYYATDIIILRRI